MQEKLFPAMAEKEKLLENVLRLVRFARILIFLWWLRKWRSSGTPFPN